MWFLLQPPARRDDIARLVGNAFEREKQVTALDVAWDLWQLYASRDYVAATAPAADAFAYGGVPESSRPVRVLRNTAYAVGYSDALGLPLWVAYRLRDGDFGGAPARPDAFVRDGRTSARIEPSDFERSGYDRGHMAPSFAIGLHFGRIAQEETFLMSNIAPQRPALNRGPWLALERRIAANYPARFGEVWVLAGPVPVESSRRLRGRVAVPEAFFMVVVDESEGRVRAQAFLLPQDAAEHADPGAFLTTIDEIERRTGLDLLPQLPADAQAVLEARRAARVW